MRLNLLLACAAATVLAGGIVTGSAAPASAHTDLVSSTPAAAETQAEPPRTVSLTFSDKMSNDFATVALLVGDQDPLTLSTTTEGQRIVATVPADELPPAAPGTVEPVAWKITYRVVSADGHPVTGEFNFRAPLPAAEEPEPTAAPTTSAPSGAPPDSAAPAPQSSSPDVTSDPRPADEEDRGTQWWVALLGVGLMTAIGAGIVATLVSQRRRGRVRDD